MHARQVVWRRDSPRPIMVNLGMPPDARGEPTLPRRTAIRMVAGTNLALGIAVIATIALAPDNTAALWTSGLLGFLVALLAALRGSRAAERRHRALALVNAALGLLILAAPIVLDATGAYAITNMVLGLLIVVFAIGGYSFSYRDEGGRARRRTRA